MELLQLELRTQQLKDESLWNYSYKKAVGLMVRKNPPPRWMSLWSLTAVARRPAEQRRFASRRHMAPRIGASREMRGVGKDRSS